MHNPCCTCAASCTISSDSFNNGTIDAKWTEDSGSWDATNLYLDGNGAGLIYDTTAHPDGVSQDMSLQLDYSFVQGGGATNTFRFLISFLDTSNYLYVEVSRPGSGCTEMQIGEVLAGVDTPIGDPFPMEQSVSLSSSRTIKICYFASTGKLRVTQTFDTGVGIEVDATGIGDKFGIEVVAGRGYFDTITFSRGYDATLYPTCPQCNSGDCIIGDHSLSGSVDSCFWDTESGTWGSGYIPTGDGVLKYRRPHPTGKSHMQVIARALVGNGETMRVYVNYADASNHLYVDAGWDSTTVLHLALYRVAAGTPTLIDERFYTSPGAVTFDQTLNLSVCYDGAYLGARLTNTGATIVLHGSAAAMEITDGVFAAIGSNGGASFTLFTLKKMYSETEPEDPSCPVCTEICGCLASNVPRGNYTVDFGAGGWTDDGCDYCDQVAGAFVLGEFATSPDGAISEPCEAIYEDGDVCVFAASCQADNDMGITISLTLEDAGGGQLKWVVFVELAMMVINDPGCPDEYARATYESDPFDPGECDVVPVTLSNISEDLQGDVCGGALPATISIDET